MLYSHYNRLGSYPEKHIIPENAYNQYPWDVVGYTPCKFSTNCIADAYRNVYRRVLASIRIPTIACRSLFVQISFYNIDSRNDTDDICTNRKAKSNHSKCRRIHKNINKILHFP